MAELRNIRLGGGAGGAGVREDAIGGGAGAARGDKIGRGPGAEAPRPRPICSPRAAPALRPIASSRAHSPERIFYMFAFLSDHKMQLNATKSS